MAYILEHYEEVKAKVAALEDPAQRAKAERLLETIRREAEAKKQAERERVRERDRGAELEFDP